MTAVDESDMRAAEVVVGNKGASVPVGQERRGESERQEQ